MKPACGRCHWFAATPDLYEKLIPGLPALGSAYASVAGDDGLCRRHNTIQSPRDFCNAFASDVVGTNPDQ